MHSELHIPVLYSEIEEIFTKKEYKNPTVIDATLGLGGHAGMFLEKMNGGIFVGFDRDEDNLVLAKKYLLEHTQNTSIGGKFFLPKSFITMKDELEHIKINGIDTVLYDLGVSSLHYDDATRGFSIREDGPLDMRFDRKHGKTAQDIVMTYEATELARIFSLFGEEKKSWFIAQEIVKVRKEEVINTTAKLLSIIERSSFDKKSAIRVFQALRIAVNEEFSHIENSLSQALSLLNVGGLIMVITFHSLEDRLVKQFFAPYLDDVIDDFTGQIQEKAHFRKYTKKPIEPTGEEIERNPRSRSAKLRVIERVY